jgi:DNA polymerase-3 subunit beta
MMNDSAFAATFNARDLAAAAKSVGKLIERRNSIPILANVLIQLGDDVATITGTDLDNWLTVMVPALVPIAARGARVTVEPTALGMILGKAEKGATAYLAFGHDKLIVETGRSRSRLATLPVDDFPLTGGDVMQSGPSFTMPAATIAHDLARLSPAMSTEETRYYLNGINVARGDAGGLAMVATDGNSAAFIDRPDVEMSDAWADTIMARKSVVTVLRLIGKKPAGDVTISLGKRIDVCGDGFWLSAKPIDGTFPDAREAVAKALGDELQACTFPDAEPRLNVSLVAGLAKPCGAVLDVAIGEKAAALTYSAAPEYLAVTMLFREGKGGRHGFGYERGAHADDRATAYLVELARSRGFDVGRYFARESNSMPRYYPLSDAEGGSRFRLQPGAGVEYVGATFGGIARVVAETWHEEADYETFTMRRVRVPAVREYEEGAFCVPMPRERRLAYAAVTIGEGDDERAIRTNAKGEIELTAAQVRAMAGPVDYSAHVAIPAARFYLGARLPEGWALPVAAKSKASASYAVAIDPARLPVWTGTGSRAWAADRAAGLLVTGSVDWDWIDRAGQAAVSEQIDAVDAVDALEAPLSVAETEAPRSGAEAGERADVPATPAETRVCPRLPSPKSPFAIAEPADDLAATVAALLARVAALEAATPMPSVAAAVVDVGTGWQKAAHDMAARLDAETARADEAERALAGVREGMAFTRDNYEAEKARAAQLASELYEANGRLARVEANGASWRAEAIANQTVVIKARAQRARTVHRGRSHWAGVKLAASTIAELESQRDGLASTVTVLQARTDRAEGEAARLRTLAPLSNIQWSGAHNGAVVARKAKPEPVAPRLVIANGRRVAA